jgi:hypothetical protein
MRQDKMDILEELFSLSVVERIVKICGASNAESTLRCYSYFLDKLDDGAVREHLKGLRKDQRDDPLFRKLKNEGHHFTHELLKLFERTFDSTHPIRRAVIF